jgi:hypothetical protein
VAEQAPPLAPAAAVVPAVATTIHAPPDPTRPPTPVNPVPSIEPIPPSVIPAPPVPPGIPEPIVRPAETAARTDLQVRVPGIALIGAGLIGLLTLVVPWFEDNPSPLEHLLRAEFVPWLYPYPVIVIGLSCLALLVVGSLWAITARAERPDAMLALAGAVALLSSPLLWIFAWRVNVEVLFAPIPPATVTLLGVAATVAAGSVAARVGLRRRWPAFVVASGGLVGLVAWGQWGGLAVDSAGYPGIELLEPSLPLAELTALAALVTVAASVPLASRGVARVAGRAVSIGAAAVTLAVLAYLLVRLATDDLARYAEVGPAAGFFWLLAGAAIALAGGIADLLLSRRSRDGGRGIGTRGGSGVRTPRPAADSGPRW